MMGFNCKMTEYAAAIGIATMNKWNQKCKNEIVSPNGIHSYYKVQD